MDNSKLFKLISEKNTVSRQALTVQEVLTTNVFKNHTVVAGNGGLNRIVRNITVSDAPDAPDWLVGEELVCTTGYFMNRNETIQKQWLECAHAHKAAGLIIKPERFIGEIPESMIALANRYDLPIICMPNSVLWPEIISDVMEIILARQTMQMELMMDFNRRLQTLLLQSKSLRTVLAEISRDTGASIVLEDIYFTTIDEYSPEETNRLSALDRKRFRMETITDMSSSNKTIPAFLLDQNSTSTGTVVVPVQAGNRMFGWISAEDIPKEESEFVRLLMESGASFVALELLNRISGTKKRSERINLFYQKIINDRRVSKAEILRHGQEWEVDLSSPSIFLHAKCSPNISPTSFRILVDTIKEIDKNSLISEDGNIITVLFHPKYKAVRSVAAECRRLAYQIVMLLESSGYSCYIGIGDVFDISDVDGFILSFNSAHIGLAEGIRRNEKIINPDQLGLARIFPYIGYWEQFSTMIDQLINPLNEKDKSLLVSLEKYVECGFNKAQAAKELEIHVNTMNYRLNRIQEILDIDASDINTWLLIYLANMVKKHNQQRSILYSKQKEEKE